MAYALCSHTVLQAPSNGTQRNFLEMLFLEMKQVKNILKHDLNENM